MRNTIGLDDDLEPNDLIVSVEHVFDLDFSDLREIDWETVGDLFEAIKARLKTVPDAGRKCATAMAFYRLRSALASHAPGRRLTPKTPLSDLPFERDRDLLVAIRGHADLDLPGLWLSRFGQAGVWLAILGFVASVLPAALTGDARWLLGLGLLPIGIGMSLWDPWKRLKDCRTLGDLARQAAGLSFRKLAEQGARAGETEIWNALVALLGDYTALPAEQIHADTFLLAKRLRRAS